MSHFQSVLFDLDGTLVDTAPDLGFALNTLLEQEGRRPLAEAL
ncbi:MAG TPA: phosphoglycolate phosphatase, partial [Gammaproteobacteria bacterium]|nr:phosphoglycolate phosphatase [Gammaproteobacteria bacterium]